jgi:LacI family transcriptional regulator
MQGLQRKSIAELAAEHLRAGLLAGRWSDAMPGVARLAEELDVSRHTVRGALRHLEAEGLLGGRGLGRSRRVIAGPAAGASRPPLRVSILRHDARPSDDPASGQVELDIIQSLEASGHTVIPCKKSQVELGHDPGRIAREMAKVPADAWLVTAGSHELLKWCSQLPVPCLALYGRTGGLAIARTGPDKAPAYRAATRKLLELGHRRIVLIVRAARRRPVPGSCERAFMDELASHGVRTGEYHLPDWEETPEGFGQLLERLFLHSAPTALIVDESARYIAAAEFLARRGINVPRQVSLVSTDNDPALAWCHPGIAHMRWDNKLIVRRVVRWVNAVRKGNPDRKAINFPSEFVPGGSIGRVNPA